MEGATSPRAVITDEAELRAIIGGPTAVVASKISDRLNELTRQFVERSPFVCVATARPDGGLDVSPRGDPAGFVRILDERTLLVPDRPGNRIADTLTNLLRPADRAPVPDPRRRRHVPRERAARIVEDAELLAPSAVEGKVPRLGILVAIEEAYTQCSKAVIRSDLWNAERHVDRSELPSSGEILRSLAPSRSTPTVRRERAERYARREGLY